jgi:hypothetical protein
VFVFLDDFFKESFVQVLALRAERGIDVETAVDAHFREVIVSSLTGAAGRLVQ